MTDTADTYTNQDMIRDARQIIYLAEQQLRTNPSDKALRKQIADARQLLAELDGSATRRRYTLAFALAMLLAGVLFIIPYITP